MDRHMCPSRRATRGPSILLQQSRLPFGQIVADRVDGESGHVGHFIGERQHLAEQRIVQVAGSHPGDKPARHEQPKLPRRFLRRQWRIPQASPAAGKVRPASRTASFMASCQEAYRGPANLGRTIGVRRG